MNTLIEFTACIDMSKHNVNQRLEQFKDGSHFDLVDNKYRLVRNGSEYYVSYGHGIVCFNTGRATLVLAKMNFRTSGTKFICKNITKKKDFVRMGPKVRNIPAHRFTPKAEDIIYESERPNDMIRAIEASELLMNMKKQ